FTYFNGGLFISRGTGQHAIRTISTDELILIVSGTLDIFEEERNFHLSAGDFLLLRQGKRHGGLSPYPKTLKFYWHHFLPKTEEAKSELEMFPSTGNLFWMKNSFQLSSQILSLQQIRDECPEKQLLLDALFSGLLLDLNIQPKQESRHGNPLAEKTRNYFLIHYAEPVSTSTAALEFGCNPDYLGRIFAKCYGHTPGDELRKIRIARAKQLLNLSNMTLKETAELCGYNDISYFHKQFFREVGMTPGQWKRLSGTGHVNAN
ncbi:MAG: helix-turn-helix transcriptional regulator, partial [Victivallales bacterium]|nr:helix-turn-helix transcriptional regulator [Victivallales bacterium]